MLCLLYYHQISCTDFTPSIHPTMIQTLRAHLQPFHRNSFYARSSLEILKLIPVSSVPCRPFFSSSAHRSGYSPSAHAWKSAWSLRPGSALYIIPRLPKMSRQ